jgi:hypothetical protein
VEKSDKKEKINAVQKYQDERSDFLLNATSEATQTQEQKDDQSLRSLTRKK